MSARRAGEGGRVMEQRQLFLRDVLTVLFKRKVSIAVFVLAVFAVVFAGNFAWPPAYESSAKIRLMRGREVSQVDPTVVRSSSGIAAVQLSREDVNSEIDLLYSNDVLQEVVKQTGLDKPVPAEAGLLRRGYYAAAHAAKSALYALGLKHRPNAVQEAVESLHKALDVELVKDSHVLDVRVRQRSPEQAQNVLQELLKVYTLKHIDVFSTPKSVAFFEDQMKIVQDKLSQAQQALEAFRAENKVVSLDTEKTLLLEQYTDAKRLLTQLVETEAAAAAAPGVSGVSLEESGITQTLSRTTNSAVVTELQLRLLELLLQRNRLEQSLGPKHPEVIGVRREIEGAQARLQDAIQSARKNTEFKLSELEKRLQELNQVQARLEDLEREARIQSESFEYYAKKMEEARVADEMSKQDMSNVKVVSEPNAPIDPVTPRKTLNLLLALIGGLIGGLALAFFLEWLDHGVKNPEDIEHYLGLAPLASFFQGPYEQLDPKEAQRLRALLDAMDGEKPRSLLEVISATQGESSHHVARALAEAYAENPETRTVFIDLVGDGIEDIPSGRGLLDVLQGDASLDDVMTRTGLLSVVGRGSAPDCPAYLWTSEIMHQTLQALRTRFDAIIVHAAPALQASDGLNIARFADGILMVVRADRTRREVVLRALDTLREAKGTVLGAVLTERRRVIPKAVYKRM